MTNMEIVREKQVTIIQVRSKTQANKNVSKQTETYTTGTASSYDLNNVLLCTPLGKYSSKQLVTDQ